MQKNDELKDFVEHILNDVSDESIESLFEEMGITIDLNKPWSDEDA